MPRRRLIDVLIIDDSAVVRQVLSGLLEQEDDIRVATAADPVIALNKIAKRRPDVIVLDIVMPRMDGLTFLMQLRQTERIPVVICSGHVEGDSESALRALQLGATEIVSKPRIGVQQFLQESRVLFVDAVRAASQIRRRRVDSADPPPLESAPILRGAHFAVAPTRHEPPALNDREGQRDRWPHAERPPAPRAAVGVHNRPVELIALGTSTGGPQALEVVFRQIPVDAPGLVVVQHMPEGFTRAFAKRLDGICRISVKEAENGDSIVAGRALIAPGNRHLLVHRQGNDLFVEVANGPLVARHRPSVNVLFRSIAVAAGPRALGVLMTGMGDDGAEGLLEMRRAGAHTIAQDQRSSAVFGMPRAAIECGAATEVVGLDDLATKIMERSRSRLLPHRQVWPQT